MKRDKELIKRIIDTIISYPTVKDIKNNHSLISKCWERRYSHYYKNERFITRETFYKFLEEWLMYFDYDSFDEFSYSKVKDSIKIWSSDDYTDISLNKEIINNKKDKRYKKN
jgi:hypothetical protein